jgi:hypothetical protein
MPIAFRSENKTNERKCEIYEQIMYIYLSLNEELTVTVSFRKLCFYITTTSSLHASSWPHIEAITHYCKQLGMAYIQCRIWAIGRQAVPHRRRVAGGIMKNLLQWSRLREASSYLRSKKWVTFATTAYFGTVSILFWSVIPAEWSLEFSRQERWSTQEWVVTVGALLERSRAIQRVFQVTSLTRTSGSELLIFYAPWRLKSIETILWSIRNRTEHCVAAICKDVLLWVMSSDRSEARLQKWLLGHLESDVSKR